jgi:hypothetical protein
MLAVTLLGRLSLCLVSLLRRLFVGRDFLHRRNQASQSTTVCLCSSIQMSRRKPRLSLFSTIAQQINEQGIRRSANDCHLIDNEYFAAFDSLDDIQQFHAKLNEKQRQTTITDNESDVQREDDMEMKSFAQQFLIDLPEQVTKDLSLNGTSSQDLFITDQPINWSPKVKGKNNVSSSAGRSARPLPLQLDLLPPRYQKTQIGYACQIKC